MTYLGKISVQNLTEFTPGNETARVNLEIEHQRRVGELEGKLSRAIAHAEELSSIVTSLRRERLALKRKLREARRAGSASDNTSTGSGE